MSRSNAGSDPSFSAPAFKTYSTGKKKVGSDPSQKEPQIYNRTTDRPATTHLTKNKLSDKVESSTNKDPISIPATTEYALPIHATL